MVKARCILILLLSSLAICCVAAFHPIAQSLSNKGSSDQGAAEKSFDGANGVPKYESEAEDSVSFQPFDIYRTLDNDLEKKGHTKNFLRFGKSSHPMMAALMEPSNTLTEEEKKAPRNFLRFGRVPQRNFLRFGKSSPLEFGLGLQPDEEEELLNRANSNNFQRFSKASDRNFLRFGRSTESQTKEDCEDCINANQQPIPDSLPSSTASLENKVAANSHRTKRSISAFYEDPEFFSPSPASWASQFTGLDPNSQALANAITENAHKRAHNRNFLRYGRDPLDLHFLRFGKRGTPGEDEKLYGEEDDEDPFSRYVRGRSMKNFLRFG